MLAGEREDLVGRVRARQLVQQDLDAFLERMPFAEEQALDLRAQEALSGDQAGGEDDRDDELPGVRIEAERLARHTRELRDDDQQGRQQPDGEERIDGRAGDQMVDVQIVGARDRHQDADRNEDLGDHRHLVQPPERRSERRHDVGQQDRNGADVDAQHHPFELPAADR
jgi:hypothetical protein